MILRRVAIENSKAMQHLARLLLVTSESVYSFHCILTHHFFDVIFRADKIRNAVSVDDTGECAAFVYYGLRQLLSGLTVEKQMVV